MLTGTIALPRSLASAALLCALALPAAAGVNRWTEIGPAETCDTYHQCTRVQEVALDPFDESLVYTITTGNITTPDQRRVNVNRLWKSTDAGTTWTRLSEGGVLEYADDQLVALRVAKSNSRILYVLSDYSVYRSTDGGVSWASSKLPNSYNANVDMVVDATKADTLYVAQNPWCEAAGCKGGIFRSEDGGRNWRLLGLDQRYISGMAADPSNPATLYVYAGELYQTRNRGGSWKDITPANANDPAIRVGGVAVDVTVPSTLYAAAGLAGYSGSAIFKSENGGLSWRAIKSWDAYSSFRHAFAIDPTHSIHILSVTVWGGVLQSFDGGENWTALNDGLTSSETNQLVIATSGTTFFGVIGGGGSDGKLFRYSFVPPRRRAVQK